MYDKETPVNIYVNIILGTILVRKKNKRDFILTI